MANISKIKRDRMIEFLNKLKKAHSDDESILALNEIENHLKERKFGLIWESHTEDVDDQLIENIPVLTEVAERKVVIDSSLPFNFVIEGDNLHSLKVLEKTHRGKIDVIYIDPPYNTGAENWRYNNNYVSKDDTYKHSLWLSKMYERIKIAKTLLSPTGFFICAIDANELFTIGLMLDDIFYEDNRLGLVTVLHNPKGRNFTKWFSANSEYMLVYAKDASKASFNDVALDEEIKASFNLFDKSNGRRYRLEPFMRSRTETLRENKPNFWYSLYVSSDLKTITREKIDGFHEVFPIAANGKEATWINLPETFDEKNKIGWFVAKNEGGKIVIYRKLYEQQVYKNVWLSSKYYSEFNGTNVLKNILGKNIFDYPKSIYLMEDILKLTSKSNSIVLDFFAGSGTTGHAVMNLNREDGGNRRFILCTNNENKICEEVTYPRVKTVVTGKREDGSDYFEEFKYLLDSKTILFEKKLSVSVLSSFKSVSKEIDEITKKEKDNFDEVKVSFEGDKVLVVGIRKALKPGMPKGNIKYFRCEFTPKRPEEYLLSNALSLHIKEMIEIQNGIDIDNKTDVLILNREDIKKYVLSEENYKNIRRVWVNQNLILNSTELRLLKAKNFTYIPKEFFGEELKEAGE